MPAIVGNDGLEGIPSLQDICDLFRSIVNDTFNDGAGEINTDSAPWMKPFLNSAVRDLYNDLRLIGDMRVVKDNFIVSGLPAIASADPSVQTALKFQGYFDGVTVNAQYQLPSDLMWVVKLWQRVHGSGAPFLPLPVAPAGLAGCYQGESFSAYEVRGQNEVWFNGALMPIDLRIRYVATFPNIIRDEIDFANTFIPIQDCTNAVAFKMAAYYAQRISPDQFSLAESQATKFTKKLKDDSIRNGQNKQFALIPFLGGDGGDIGIGGGGGAVIAAAPASPNSNFADNETPTATGNPNQFLLAHSPVSGSLQLIAYPPSSPGFGATTLYLGVDYNLAGATIVIINGNTYTADQFRAWYRF